MHDKTLTHKMFYAIKYNLMCFKIHILNAKYNFLQD